MLSGALRPAHVDFSAHVALERCRGDAAAFHYDRGVGARVRLPVAAMAADIARRWSRAGHAWHRFGAGKAALLRRRESNPRCMDSKPEISLCGILEALSPSDSPRCRAVAAEGERENRRQPVGELSAIGNLMSRTLLSPLPRGGGEGQGEGVR